MLIGKAMVEIPPKFADHPPINPKARAEPAHGESRNGKGAQGLAEDVRYYGKWMRDEAQKRIGHLYPKARLRDGTEATVIAPGYGRARCAHLTRRQGAHGAADFVLHALDERRKARMGGTGDRSRRAGWLAL